MTDRLQGLTVAFERDIRDDDADAIIAAIKQLRGVAGVTPHVVDINAFVARARAQQDIEERLWKALRRE